MIGKFIAALDKPAREGLVVANLAPGYYERYLSEGRITFCVVGAAVKFGEQEDKTYYYNLAYNDERARCSVEDRFDALCNRYGTARVAQWIRYKVLFGSGPAMSYKVVKSMYQQNVEEDKRINKLLSDSDVG